MKELPEHLQLTDERFDEIMQNGLQNASHLERLQVADQIGRATVEMGINAKSDFTLLALLGILLVLAEDMAMRASLEGNLGIDLSGIPERRDLPGKREKSWA